MNRDEHLEFAKKRAIDILEKGDIQGAYTSMVSDMDNHEDLRSHVAIDLGFQMLVSGHLATEGSMRKFIDDFN